MSDIDYDDDQLEPSDDEDIDEEMIYSEICVNNESDEAETNLLDDIIEYDEEIEIVKKIKTKIKNKSFLGRDINIDDIQKSKQYYLYLIKYNELLSIFLNYNNTLQKGSTPLLDEIMLKKMYNIELFNNPLLTTETVTMIMLLIMNIPICVKKYSNMYNREVINIDELSKDYLNCYYYNIKNMLRGVTYNTNNKFNFDVFINIFPTFIKNINFDLLTNEELDEIKYVKRVLSNYVYENL
ncbi:RNA polymerase RPO19 [Mythimna separata entomopoxvirus 'L']|uniref:RNA polymerase RPO19 n=1 Tax=Mythimna separata entomopoxvirus 'L' TaxID=1293572 RepID=A0A916KQJ0_9POXV|nr:RNA polymerase RPO19 [Mythimna separata entomopoxvirus 'L']CCU56400.1 RNA polymerase RPO19 [Mythimna separata entomopoxvirus 'L']